jgi:hypothetical protein
MTNSEILKTINGEIRTLVKAFEVNKINQPTDIRSEWMNTVEASHALGISAKSLQRLRNCGSLPYSRVHGKVYYKKSDLEQLLERNYRKLNVNHCGCK